MYCDQQGLAVGFLYCNTLKCIVTRGGRGKAAVSRHDHDTAVFARSTRPRHDHLAYDTAEGPGHDTARHSRLGATTWSWGRHDTATRARLGAQARPSWVHCAPDSVLTQFLDSVLFLSHCLDIVHEHCSKKIFRKKK